MKICNIDSESWETLAQDRSTWRGMVKRGVSAYEQELFICYLYIYVKSMYLLTVWMFNSLRLRVDSECGLVRLPDKCDHMISPI